jgi:septum formation protein
VTPPLVLASSSPRRKALLDQIGLEVEVVPATVAEYLGEDEDVAAAVLRLAAGKAADVAARLPGRAVLGADTLVAVDGEPLGKPTGRDEARSMLHRLSGRWHDVFTGVVLIIGDGRRAERLVHTAVHVADLTGEEIERYTAGPEPYDKAGAYAIQGTGGWIVTEIRGSASNVTGLPLDAVRSLLAEAGLPLPSLGDPQITTA